MKVTGAAELRNTILTALLRQYAEEHDIEADKAEIDGYVTTLRADREPNDEDLSGVQMAEIEGLGIPRYSQPVRWRRGGVRVEAC